jgi:transcription antitermination factor NusG
MACVVESTSLDVEAVARRLPCLSYVPTYSREIRHARRVETRAFPLYGRYFFAWFEPQQIRSVLRTRGVVGVLRRAGSILPAVVDDAFVEGLKSTVISTDFELGDDIEIKQGSWKGFRGALGAIEEERVAVMFSLLGRRVEMWVDKRDVSRLPNKDDGSVLLKQDRRL